jgi:cytochrome c553
MEVHRGYSLRVSIYRSVVTGFVVMALMTSWTSLSAASEPAVAATEDQNRNTSAAALALFESKIRPVLIRECYSCHSAEAKKGPKANLRVDTREGLIRGGDSGAAVVPGKPMESLLLKALRGDDGVALMPPKGKLPDTVIIEFEKWIRLGAPDPRGSSAPPVSRNQIDWNQARQFWSFQPLRPRERPLTPADVDALIAAPLQERKLPVAPEADRVTLLRRLYLDLIGLPPSPEEIAAFEQDEAPDAYEKVVDRLLASPHFGERWGRHWLDLARYADSNGKDENLTYHEAYLYRDYVIRSFNHDKPYGRFIVEQLAGDLLPANHPDERDELLIATGFLVVGPKVLAERDKVKLRMDVVDEQLDTIGKVFFGLALGCARCHDHKFDPIPTSDYYALAGILRSTRTIEGIKRNNNAVSGWIVRPLGPSGEQQLAEYRQHQEKLKQVQQELQKARQQFSEAEQKAQMRSPQALAGITVDDTQARRVGMWKESTFTKPYVGAGYIHDDRSGKGEKEVVFVGDLPKAGQYEVLIAYTPGSNRATNVPVVVRHQKGETTFRINQTRRPPIDGIFHSLGVFTFGQSGTVTIRNAGTDGYVIVDAVRFVPAGELAQLSNQEMGVPPEVKRTMEQARELVRKWEAEEAALKKTAPPVPRMAMAVRDEDQIEDCRINIRGNPHQLGEVVPRGVLRLFPDATPPQMPKHQSGRRELAEWIAAQPLTARVAVNRIWAHLFGQGIVRTVDDFGAQGERPSHPELLEALAAEFVRNGGSHKQLIRLLVLTRTYRQSVHAPEALLIADPENRLFGRANRRRLEAEVLRDAILTVSGQLDRRGGGPVVSHLGEVAVDNNSRSQSLDTDTIRTRSVYLPIIRNELPPILEVFDFADPDVPVGHRDATTVSTQALFLMNSTFANRHARLAATRLMAEAGNDEQRLERLFLLAYGRKPTSRELQLTLNFLQEFSQKLQSLPKERQPKDTQLEAWTAVCLSVFASHEFRYVE